jgi:hypothetical protein
MPTLTPQPDVVPARAVLRGLPRLRSGLTRSEDGQEQWQCALNEILSADFMRSRRNGNDRLVRGRVINMLAEMRSFKANRGAEFIPCHPLAEYRPDWFLDPAFVASYARVYGHQSIPC